MGLDSFYCCRCCFCSFSSSIIIVVYDIHYPLSSCCFCRHSSSVITAHHRCTYGEYQSWNTYNSRLTRIQTFLHNSLLIFIFDPSHCRLSFCFITNYNPIHKKIHPFPHLITFQLFLFFINLLYHNGSNISFRRLHQTCQVWW